MLPHSPLPPFSLKSFSPFPFSIIYDWYILQGRTHLPWRQVFYLPEKKRAYSIWLSEVLLQQTQVERVIGYYKKILHQFGDILCLANTSYEEFFPYYEGLGYYSRAKNLLRCARIVSQEYAGIFPQEKKYLISLPGIGEYTACALQAFCYGIPVLAFDTNLERIFSRYYFGHKFHKFSKQEKQIFTHQLEQFISQKPKQNQVEYVRAINAGLMDFASQVCVNKKEAIIWEDYCLKQSQFYITRGKQEQAIFKKTDNFPLKQSILVCILHKDHKIYLSKDAQNYNPFFCKNTGPNFRDSIKSFFRKEFCLLVSVRPVHKKTYINSHPYACCYVQIQSGIHQFFSFSKQERIFWESKFF